ncbi:hypothetical protein G5I_01296 [Acromyrmex echinatior]|uniref:Uncharacterized protein n=1 Tax=Acromyrmex echinatior TaxID=103372 RepID=F4W787_ACREC|nr:hypothetical protein G5I_01296 [Acromyrmex echinatior]
MPHLANLMALWLSRRFSQDVTTSKSTENLSTSYVRSKSRSVDHGFTAPFDLDALRNKVEGRFESVDKLSREESSSLYCSESFLYCPTYSYGNEVCTISPTLLVQNIKRVRVDRFGRQEVSTVNLAI